MEVQRLAFDNPKEYTFYGNYSRKFYNQIHFAVARAADLAEHMASLITTKPQYEDKVDGSKDLSVPMNLSAFNDVNELYKRLVYWTGYWGKATGNRPPLPSVNAWRNQQGTIIGLPNDLEPADVRYVVGIMSQWIDIMLPTILSVNDHEAMMLFHEDMKDIYRLLAKFPLEERPRYSSMPCPDDSCKGKIAVYPPKEFLDDEEIVCEGCGRWFEPAQYEFLIGVFQQVALEKRKGKSVVNHLLRKYA